ncbi:MAG: aspartyl-tRNA(Asn)/glutamyl-tRNA (Gln) amidotransferase subunit B [archaeon GW2011_AR5]|nr:MAG: aspartyl-tRNA(Asn)/glutamyl-tRNA (Gln) amidotransferase subunit B [archaeon GW2011_AR5]
MKIGLEVHVQLRTQTKLFCGCPNKFVSEPNTQVCDYCLGMPGTKPRVNRAALDFAILIGTALDCKISSPTYFSRKSYFYPDMGKNFQITQYEVPIAHGGHVKLGTKQINITRIQLEEDPARIVHSGGQAHDDQGRRSSFGSGYVLVDYNRSGVPLCEIVTDPDFESPKEAREFLQKLSSILEYLGVYDPNVEGSMRVDANISLGPSRVEIKNISGFKDVEKALNYEAVRQKNMLRRGQKIARETRGWDDVAGVTRSQRTKEEEEDYGYIFEGDLPKFNFTSDKLEKLKNAIPELPDQKVKRYVREMKIPEELAVSIVSEPDLAEAFEKIAARTDRQLAAKWFAGEIKKTLNFNNLRWKDSKLTVEGVSRLLEMVQRKAVTDHTAEMMLRDMAVKQVNPEENIQTRIYDEDSINDAIQEVLGSNTKAVVDYKSGKQEAFNFLVGQVMRKTQGRGDPDTIRNLLKKLI